ncbi:MAG: recombination protein RecR [Acidobacteria bacterium]|uniref:Recombination protein RecR n=1 Tax=Candidatus Polarisedimenticola svalbardensis TaxID=2886004 RepID=A0A8J6Y1K9_9BACT|nr:recombination protein RecR [Candidatus Polarisedimenticola svalbardensis]
MGALAPPIERVIAELSKLPSIGRKTAQRLAFHLLKVAPEEIDALAQALSELPRKVRYCSNCFHLTEQDPCDICTDPGRDQSRICVVEDPVNVIALDRTGAFKGTYHVLGGALSPLRDIGPEDLRIEPLLGRVRKGGVRELILATNPNVEGEATAVYLSRVLAGEEVRITRLAQGLPAGGDLEFTDDLTLLKAFEGRRDF